MLDLLETWCSSWLAICCIAHICMTDVTSLVSLFFWFYVIIELLSLKLPDKYIFSVNHIQVGSFWGCSRIGVHKCPPPLLPKICHTYPTMMKLSTVIPCLTRIQNIYKSRDTTVKFGWHHYFFTKNQQL